MRFRYLYTIIFIYLGFSTNNAQSCLPGGITFSTQAQIDAFPTNYPGCTQILGDVCIGDCTLPFTNTNISNLNGLSQLTSINKLWIRTNPNLNDLSPLYGLENVPNGLNLNLTASTIINGFNSLIHVGGILSFHGGITSITGFNAVTTPYVNIQLTSSQLTSIDGFNNIESARYLFFSDNSNLTSVIGFQNLNTIYFGDPSLGGLVLRNSGLDNLTFLANVSSIEQFKIENNANLTSLNDLTNLGTITGNVTITSNPNLGICEIQAICNRVSPLTGVVQISNNALNCNSIQAVQNACLNLPIYLLSFNVNEYEENIILHWQTSSEINNHYFDIEYSVDGTDFSSIGRKEGAGNSNTKFDYHFVHENVKSGMHYYRLKQVDYDGQYSYSDMKSVLVKGESSDVLIYPNPTSDIININDADGLHYALYDLVGRQVKSGQITNSVISIDHLTTGMYYLHLDRDTGKSVCKIWKE